MSIRRDSAKRKTAQNHCVDRAASEIEAEKSGKARHRDRDQDGNGGPYIAQEQKNHQGCQTKPNGSFVDDILHRNLDEDRLIKDHIGFEDGGNVEEVRNGLFDTVHDGDRVGIAALLEYRDVDGVLAVYANDVGLELPPVFRVTNISDLHRSISDGL